MTKRMLIDATHAEETRVAVASGNKLEEFDFESEVRKQLKGNIYLVKVTRVEPSLQAAFVDYGGNRHGFLPFPEIHPDYYRIPIADREALIAEQGQEMEMDDDENGQTDSDDGDEDGNDDDNRRKDVETVGGDVEEDTSRQKRANIKRNYKIQEVITSGQIMLIQINKEERGQKGAAVTSYISLPGRYCVLMPNSPRGGGVSRKVSNSKDRGRLKDILKELKVPEGMSVILRTAGASRTKAEIKRDLDYLLKLWNKIREETLKSTAPALIHEEGNLVKRAVRDLYRRDIDEVLVAGESAYREAKDFMKLLMPSHAKRVQQYKEENIPLFHRYKMESQIDEIHSPTVHMKSGGYIVINPTEALISIDVNSGRATKGRHIEETALKTNLEAAEEVARQLRLRDFGGLVVIDFIDMEVNRNNRKVERCLKEAMQGDRARIQLGRISAFGLLELSRQRLRPSLVEANFETCPTCKGIGVVRTVESAAVLILRSIEEEAMRGRAREINITVPTDIALYILNQKRAMLADIESRHSVKVFLSADDNLNLHDFTIGLDGQPPVTPQPESRQNTSDDNDSDDEKPRGRRRRRRRRGRGGRDKANEEGEDTSQSTNEGENAAAAGDEEQSEKPRSRRRGRRGGRRRKKEDSSTENTAADQAETQNDATPSQDAGGVEAKDAGDTKPDEKPAEKPAAKAKKTATKTKKSAEKKETEAKEDKPKKTRTTRKKKAEDKAAGKAEEASADVVSIESGRSKSKKAEKPAKTEPEKAEADNASDDKTDKPKKRGWWNRGKD